MPDIEKSIMLEDHITESFGVVASGQIGALWGKSARRAGGSTNLLLSHLLDTAAVAEQIWDHYLSPSVRWMIDDLAGGSGKGRWFFAWLSGMHDCGKATPAFQCVDDAEAEAVRRSGLRWDRYAVGKTRWRHDKAGGKLINRVLTEAGWSGEQIAWVWPMVAGHHGTFPSFGQVRGPRAVQELQGKGDAWVQVQDALVATFTWALGFEDLTAVQPETVPSRAAQLQLSGFIVMADWIASDERHFPGLDTLGKVSIGGARVRAAKAWKTLGLRGGWGRLPFPGAGTFRDRFDEDARPSQNLAIDVARRMGGQGLLIVEAPTGEGKTKAALIAVEVLAARFGADGVFVGMPTQATSDPMYENVRHWLVRVGADLDGQVALLHGKRMFNHMWRKAVEGGGEDPDRYCDGILEDDQYGQNDCFGVDSPSERSAPADWFLGPKRGLLASFVVGTIDQLLFAATRTKHVMLRVAGLVGKVVVLDEVHAADVYMSQFLKECLWWLGQAQVPVILLSATLPPGQRRELVSAYLAGAAAQDEFEVSDLPEPAGYPSVTAAWMARDHAEFLVDDVRSWREDLKVSVEVLAEQPPGESGPDDAADRAVAELLEERLGDGGCALIIRNTVPRAQNTYEVLRARFGGDVRLLHGRLNVRDRADRTGECLELLGPPGKAGKAMRPDRLIVVATQLAEQSFDVDADLLITDLAPIDLLLQRLGREHRHGGVRRPGRLRIPRLVVTGFASPGEAPPWIQPGSEGIYGRYLLLRTAALVTAVDGATWSVPSQVPALVASVYDDGTQVVPVQWAEAERKAAGEWRARQNERRDNAASILLTRLGEHGSPTLDGLHFAAQRGSLRDEQFQALVRDGKRSAEVVLVRRDERGFVTLKGRSLGPNGDASAELFDEVLGGTVRLPTSMTEVAERELVPLDGWRDNPWFRYSRALVLDADGRATVGDFVVRYDDELGLVVLSGGPGR